ncbi:MAG: M23 family metallopeptidase [Thermoleophilia bacterium]
MAVRSRLLPLAVLAGALLASSLAGAASAVDPEASATALGVRVVVPGGETRSAGSVTAPSGGSASVGGFVFEGLVATGSISVEARTRIDTRANAIASAQVGAISLFGGEVRADGVTVQAGARARTDAANGDLSASSVSGLVVDGQPIAVGPNTQVQLGDWGYAVALEQAVTTEDAEGKGYRGFVVGLHVRLTADHGGFPAGTEIMIGYAEAAVRSGVSAPEPEPAPTEPTEPAPETGTEPEPAEPEPAPSAPAEPTPAPRTPTPSSTPPKPVAPAEPAPAPAPSPTPTSPVLPVAPPATGVPRQDGPPDVSVTLTGDGYVFPVYGPEASFGDDFNAARSSTGWHHGNDIFGPVGAPVLAVADGELFLVGWNTLGGWRLWLRDEQGNEYYYAHLSAFSPKAVDGARVKAGDVIGFLGRSGEARTTPPHLHFEIHPRELLGMGYDGVIDPYPYLSAWRRLQDVPIGADGAPVVPGTAPAAQPTAAADAAGLAGPAPPAAGVIVGYDDISSASGLDTSALERVLSPTGAEGEEGGSATAYALVVLPLRPSLVGAPPGFAIS